MFVFNDTYPERRLLAFAIRKFRADEGSIQNPISYTQFIEILKEFTAQYNMEYPDNIKDPFTKEFRKLVKRIVPQKDPSFSTKSPILRAVERDFVSSQKDNKKLRDWRIKIALFLYWKNYWPPEDMLVRCMGLLPLLFSSTESSDHDSLNEIAGTYKSHQFAVNGIDTVRISTVTISEAIRTFVEIGDDNVKKETDVNLPYCKYRDEIVMPGNRKIIYEGICFLDKASKNLNVILRETEDHLPRFILFTVNYKEPKDDRDTVKKNDAPGFLRGMVLSNAKRSASHLTPIYLEKMKKGKKVKPDTVKYSDLSDVVKERFRSNITDPENVEFYHTETLEKEGGAIEEVVTSPYILMKGQF
ncbi:MAG: hypothetical protein AAFW83_09010 [Pseudomonadota bacterium]